MERDSDRGPSEFQRVAVIIPCQDARKHIAATVRACRAIPSVDLIVVVDDGSSDDTSQVARAAGAVAVRHSVPRGRASAMETGVKVVAMRDRADWPPRNLLFLTADLGESAVEANALVTAVNSGEVDCAIGVDEDKEAGRRLPGRLRAAKGIKLATGWEVRGATSWQRCVTREAVNAVMPFSNGWGVDVGMTIDLLVKGYTVMEVPCDFHHLAKSPAHSRRFRRAFYWDIWWALWLRRLLRYRVPKAQRETNEPQGPGVPYTATNVAKPGSGQ